MDSLKHTQYAHSASIISDYIRCFVAGNYERKMKRALLKPLNSDTLPTISPEVPQQDNCVDCGVYTIQFAEEMLKSQARVTKADLENNMGRWLTPTSFRYSTIRDKRVHIRAFLELQRYLNQKQHSSADTVQWNALAIASQVFEQGLREVSMFSLLHIHIIYENLFSYKIFMTLSHFFC